MAMVLLTNKLGGDGQYIPGSDIGWPLWPRMGQSGISGV